MRKTRNRATLCLVSMMTLGLLLGLAVAGAGAADTLEGPSHVVAAEDGSFSYAAVFTAGEGGTLLAGWESYGGENTDYPHHTADTFCLEPPLDPGEQFVLPIEGSLIDPTQLGGVTVVFWDCSTSELTLETTILPFGTIQITDNDSDDLRPAISGSTVVWYGCDGGVGSSCDGGDWEIYLWDGVTTTQITHNDSYDQGPEVSGSTVVWYGCDGGEGPGCDGGDWEIYLWDGATVTQLTDNGTDDESPAISGSNVVWEGDWDIYLWDGVTTTDVTSGGASGRCPGISGSKVVWEGPGGPSEIYVWDGATTTQIVNDTPADFAPRISGSNVVWYGGSNPWEGEIYFWDGVTVTNISNNGRENSFPRISGSNVVWYGCDVDTGPLCPGGGDYEIYLWDGASITQITNNSRAETSPDISGSNVVWSGCDGGTGSFCEGGDWEIYMTTITAPTPVPSLSFGGLALLAGLVLGSVAWARRRS